MKNICAFVIISLGALAVSCASRPALLPSKNIVEERHFEKAIKVIKMNSKLIKKNFEPREVIISGSGYKTVNDIAVKGSCLIDESEFPVSYDFSAAASTDGKHFSIPFSVEDFENDVSYTDVLSWSPADEDAGLLLSFDDTFWDTWRQYFDLFDTYGAKVTFFVQGCPESRAPSAKDTDLKKFCAEAVRRGHSLGFHSVNHLNLTKVSAETFYEETAKPADIFSKEGIHFSAFAYPFGFSEPWMHEALSPIFHVTRGYGTNIRFYDTKMANNGYIISKAIDNTIYPDEIKFENDIRLILLAAKFTGHCIVPFTTHDISDSAQWGIQIKRLEYLLETARDLKLKFYTYNGLRDRFAANG